MAIGALCTAACAAIVDVRSGRIPNWLTGGGLLAALVLQFYFMGWRGLGTGVSGALVGGGILFVPFLVRGIGAGDVKLMAAVGAWVGIQHAVAAIFATAIAGGVLAVAYVVFHDQSATTFRRVADLMQFHIRAGLRPHPGFGKEEPASIRFPYSLAIVSGALYVFVSTARFIRG